MNHRLYRCRHDRRLAGVASGLAEFFDLDPTLMRIIWFVSIFVTGGLSILLYFALAIIVPIEPLTDVEIAEAGATGHVAHRHVTDSGSGRWTTFIGVALILLGGLALLDALLPSWVDSWRYLGPAFVVGIGALLVVGAMRRDSADPPEAIGTPES